MRNPHVTLQDRRRDGVNPNLVRILGSLREGSPRGEAPKAPGGNLGEPWGTLGSIGES